MAATHFSGPVVSGAGFVGTLLPPAGVGYGIIFTPITTATLPPASVALTGAVALVSDNGVANNEYCLVICTGVSWVTATGQALT
jgi:hypothetical protein